MLKNSFIISSFLIVSIFISNAYGQKYPERYVIKGSVQNENSHEGVSLARIINKTHIHGVYSDSLGSFHIRVALNDTLFISALGYYPREIIVRDSLLGDEVFARIYLNEEVNDLGEIDIQTLGTYEEFKYNVLHLHLKSDVTEELVASINQAIHKLPSRVISSDRSFVLGSPIDALYQAFSKEGKSRTHFKKVLQEERVWKDVRQKYNKDVVARVTGLSGDTLDQFMAFCTINNDFILLASEYDICKKVEECYESFKAEGLLQKETN